MPLDQALIIPNLEHLKLPRRHIIATRHRLISHLYFLDHGIVSIVAIGEKRKQIEVGFIGSESVTGLPVVLVVTRSPSNAYVQVAGDGHRIATAELLACMRESSTLRAVLLQYVFVFMQQLADTAASNGHGRLDVRLARRLLLARDRSLVDELPLTHEFLSMMLAVHRPAVSFALSQLKTYGGISAQRGVVTLLDRPKLELLAGKYYGACEAEYERLFALATVA